MTERKLVKGLKFLIFAMVIIAGFGQATLQLWNWLMPQIFGLPRIGFWQAVGLLALSWILFGGLRGLRPRGAWGGMSPEDRARFRQGMKQRCQPKTA